MRYFREVELADYLPISEAADWIAFGLLPEAVFSDDGIEERQVIDSILDRGGHEFTHNLYLGRRYISAFFPEINAEEYISAYEGALGQTPSEIEQAIARIDISANEHLEDSCADDADRILPQAKNEFKAQYLLELEEAKKLRKLQNPIMHKLMAARTKILMCLISGELQARGLPLPAEKEIHDLELFEFPDSFLDISPQDWDMEAVDWPNSNLRLWDKVYLGVIISTHDLLKKFPKPDISPATLSGDLYGGTLIIESEGSRYTAPDAGRQKLGAPHRTELILETAIHSHLSKLKKNGVLASKAESQIAEISDFVQSKLGQTIPRSTAQRILGRWRVDNAQKDAHKDSMG